MTTNTNEPDKTKTKVSKLYDPDATPLWLSVNYQPAKADWLQIH